MCLGIPGQISNIVDTGKKLAMVNVSGIERQVTIAPITDHAPDNLTQLVGCWVLVHVGFAMSLIDEDEAKATLALLEELGEAQEEIRAMQESSL